MRHPGSVVYGRVTGSGALLLLTLACVAPDVARHPAGGSDGDAVARAQEGIARQIARRVDAMQRLDIDAVLADADTGWARPDGRSLTREQMREALAREWEAVERTVDLTVRIDSLRLVRDDSALVYTSQRWERVMRAADGSRHTVVTSDAIEQPWTRRAGTWRSLASARQLASGPTLIDGREVGVVVAEP